MRKILMSLGLGIAGVALALGLTVGALAVAGPNVGEPPTPPALGAVLKASPTPTEPQPHRNDGKDDDRSPSKPTDSPTSDASTGDGGGTSDDHGSGDDSGSEDHGSGDGGSHEDSDSGSEDDEPDDD